MIINVYTGNRIVDKVGKMNITGNTIPEAWYRTVVNENGKVNLNSIVILADIVYWYRPTEIRDERSNNIEFKKKFSDEEFLQRNYNQICNKFNISEKQARDAIILLENIGVVKRHFRTIDTVGGKISNVMFLELDPDVLYAITYPVVDEIEEVEPPINKNVNSYLPECKEVVTNKEIAVSQNVNTYTKTITETTTEINTTTPIVELKEIVNQFGITLCDKDLLAILRAANNDLDKCKDALNILKAKGNKKIDNVVGWIIAAIKNEYGIVSKNFCNNSFNNFKQNTYDYDELEKFILAN